MSLKPFGQNLIIKLDLTEDDKKLKDAGLELAHTDTKKDSTSGVIVSVPEELYTEQNGFEPFRSHVLNVGTKVFFDPYGTFSPEEGYVVVPFTGIRAVDTDPCGCDKPTCDDGLCGKEKVK